VTRRVRVAGLTAETKTPTASSPWTSPARDRRRPPDVEEILTLSRKRGDVAITVHWTEGAVIFTPPLDRLSATEAELLRVTLEVCAGRRGFTGR
jgi:hypothetical protein